MLRPYNTAAVILRDPTVARTTRVCEGIPQKIPVFLPVLGGFPNPNP
jgi:hypothetical protein